LSRQVASIKKMTDGFNDALVFLKNIVSDHLIKWKPFVSVVWKSVQFVELNMADALLTHELVARGFYELNPIMRFCDVSVTLKAFAALGISILLAITGKHRILDFLNYGFSIIVLWNGGWLIFLLVTGS
jgi:hypothetical protein